METQRDQTNNPAASELARELLQLRQRAARAAELLDMHRKTGSFDEDYLQTYSLLEALDLRLARLLKRLEAGAPT